MAKPSPSTPVRLLSISAEAKELDVTTETLRRWRRDGVGPRWIDYGGIVRYFPETQPAD